MKTGGGRLLEAVVDVKNVGGPDEGGMLLGTPVTIVGGMLPGTAVDVDGERFTVASVDVDTGRLPSVDVECPDEK